MQMNFLNKILNRNIDLIKFLKDTKSLITKNQKNQSNNYLNFKAF